MSLVELQDEPLQRVYSTSFCSVPAVSCLPNSEIDIHNLGWVTVQYYKAQLSCAEQAQCLKVLKDRCCEMRTFEDCIARVIGGSAGIS